MTTSDHPGDWRARLIDDDAGIARILDAARRIGVLGIKMERHQPAFYVPAYAQAAGYEIVPIPVYYPDATEILGRPVYRTLAAVPESVDLVNVFRRPADIPAHLDDIIAKRPAAVWFQSGIRNEGAAERLAREGIEVVQDRCLMVELQRMGR